eukprot:3211808-Rhodomonas_salina.2
MQLRSRGSVHFNNSYPGCPGRVCVVRLGARNPPSQAQYPGTPGPSSLVPDTRHPEAEAKQKTLSSTKLRRADRRETARGTGTPNDHRKQRPDGPEGADSYEPANPDGLGL